MEVRNCRLSFGSAKHVSPVMVQPGSCDDPPRCRQQLLVQGVLVGPAHRASTCGHRHPGDAAVAAAVAAAAADGSGVTINSSRHRRMQSPLPMAHLQ